MASFEEIPKFFKFVLLGTWQTGGKNVPAVLIGDLGDGKEADGRVDETRLNPCRPSGSSLENDDVDAVDIDVVVAVTEW